MSFSDAIHQYVLLGRCPVCSKPRGTCNGWESCYEEWALKGRSANKYCPLCRSVPMGRIAEHAGKCCARFARAIEPPQLPPGTLVQGTSSKPTKTRAKKVDVALERREPLPTSRDQGAFSRHRATNESNKKKGTNTSTPLVKDKGVNTCPSLSCSAEETGRLSVAPRVKRNIYAKLNALRREIESILGPDVYAPSASAMEASVRQEPTDEEDSRSDDADKNEEGLQPSASPTEAAEGEYPTAEETEAEDTVFYFLERPRGLTADEIEQVRRMLEK